MKFEDLERLAVELRDEKLQREAIEKYKKERFAFWKDVALVTVSVLSAVISVIAFVRTL